VPSNPHEWSAESRPQQRTQRRAKPAKRPHNFRSSLTLGSPVSADYCYSFFGTENAGPVYSLFEQRAATNNGISSSVLKIPLRKVELLPTGETRRFEINKDKKSGAKRFGAAVSVYNAAATFLDLLRNKLSAVWMPLRLKYFRSSEAVEIVNFAMSHRVIQPQQIKEELLEFALILKQSRPRFILEIGTCNGGSLFVISRLAQPDSIIISIDLPGGTFGGKFPAHHFPILKRIALPRQTLHLLEASSHDASTKEQVASLLANNKLDLLFIDGDHSYEGVKRDFEMYAPLVRPGGLVGFHDIAHHPPELHSDVDLFWSEVKTSYPHREIIHNPQTGWAGIGMVYV
jgi:predicted O-methyltransferase YrrM